MYRVQNNIKSDPSSLSSFLQTKNGTSRIPCSLSDDAEETFSDPQDIVNAFARTFSPRSNCVPTETSSYVYNNCLSITHVTPEDLISTMAKLTNKRTSGDDLIPSFLIRDCRYILAQPLSIIINLALKTSTFPLE